MKQRLIKKEVVCWGTGNVFREFLHVDDLANACYFALTKWDPESENSKSIHGELINYLNVGTGKDLSIKELAKTISSLVGFEGSIVWDHSKPDGTPRKN